MKFFDSALHLADSAMVLAGDLDAPHARPPELLCLRDATHPTCPYYKFIDALTRLHRPFDVIEIGTYVGTSAAHFANANCIRRSGQSYLWGQVTTIDINPDAKRCVDELGYPNIRAITGDSLVVLSRLVAAREKFDVLYIDGNHTFAQAYAEYFHFRRLVRDGGLILIDDAGLQMDGDEMNVLWETITEPKQRVDHLHPNVGFGIIEKRNETMVMGPNDAAYYASPIIASRRKKPS